MTQAITQNYGPFRVSNRHSVIRLTREPTGPTKTKGPRLGLDGWIFGHIGYQRLNIPNVGLERKTMGLTGNSRPVVEPVEVRDGSRHTPSGTGGSRGSGRRKRKQEKLQVVYDMQDAQVAKIRKRDRERAKIAAAREMSALVQFNRTLSSGNVRDVITNPAFEVVS